MITIIIGIHVVVCFLLICMILIQSGRGGGLIESFSGMESVFGTKTSAFMTKFTSILSVLFFLSCLTLAFLSVQQSRSLMSGVKPVTSAVKKTAALPEKQSPEAAAQQAAVVPPPARPQAVPAVSEPAAVPAAEKSAGVETNQQKVTP